MWCPHLLYATAAPWAVVRQVPAAHGCFQLEAAPGSYQTYEAAQVAAQALNRAEAPRHRSADRYGLLPMPAEDYHPHPWDLK